jgi:hypothetical protein
MRSLTFSILCIFTSVFILQAQVINYEWPTTVPKSDFYEIKVFQNNQEYEIHPHLSTPYKESNFYWPDRDLTDGNNNGLIGYIVDRSMTFGTFSFEGEITIEVTKLYGQSASRVEIAPKSFGINPTFFDGRTVRFNINHDMSDIAKYIAVDFISNDNLDSDTQNGFHIKNSVMIFADKPETGVPDLSNPNVKVFQEDANFQNANIIYIKKGDYNMKDFYNSTYGEDGQMLFTKHNQTIYMEPGTFIRGAFHGKGFDGIKLKGRAIVTGQNYPFHWFRDSNDKKDAFINFIGCDNIEVEGMIIENPTHHTIPSSKNSKIKNIKIIGWAFNQDGVRPSSGGVVDQIFIKSQDDYDYARDPHVVKNSVFWPTHNGACGMVGWNNLGTGYAEYRNMAYINSETRNVNNNTGILGSQAKDGMKLRDNVFEDLVIEDNNAYLVNLTVTPDGVISSGFFDNFLFKNITTEYPFSFSNGSKAIQRMNGIQDNWLTNWKFINVIVDGVLLTFDNHQQYFNMSLQGTNGNNVDEDNYVRNVTFGTEGDLFEISVNSGNGGSIHPSGSNGKVVCLGNKDQSISIEPNIGQRIKTITVDGELIYEYGNTEKPNRKQTVKFSKVNQNHSLVVEFEAGNDYFNATLNNPEFDKPLLKIFPNPVKDILKLENLDGLFDYKIYDAIGKIVTEKYKVFSKEISTKELSKGIYILEVIENNIKTIIRFIKE